MAHLFGMERSIRATLSCTVQGEMLKPVRVSGAVQMALDVVSCVYAKLTGSLLGSFIFILGLWPMIHPPVLLSILVR